jgi:5-methylcytosine-specific restriction endonuclease McrA
MGEKLLDKMIEKGCSRRDATVFVRAKGCCEYCGEQLMHDRIKWGSVQFDHIIPKSEGGSDDHENLALSCKVCNNAKMTFIPSGAKRSELINTAAAHIRKRRKNANEFWLSISSLFSEHNYT